VAKKGEVIEGQLVERPVLKLVPQPRLRIPLRTVREIRRELARVYRDMRTNRIEDQQGTRLSYVLFTLGRLVELDDLETRLGALEQAVER
jgi:hypothetical protein